MQPAMWMVISVILATFVAMASGRFRNELVALTACCVLAVSGVLSTSDLFPALGSDAVVTVGAMFVLSAALERTGVIESASRFLQRLPVRSEFAMLCVLLPPVIAVSAFVNNTPVVVVFLPIIVAVARRNHLSLSALLIPLSFASIVGGSTTLIGTSTNLVASTAGFHAGLAPISMFELTPAALLLAAISLVYLLALSPRLLPRRETVTMLMDEPTTRHYLTEAFVPADSALIGRTGADALNHAQARGRVVELIRQGEAITSDAATVPLQAGDRLRITVDAASFSTLKHRRSLRLQTAEHSDLALGRADETQLVECVVTPRSPLLGRSLGELELSRREGLVVLALHRSGTNVKGRIDDIALESGDVLLLEATADALADLCRRDELLVLAGARRLPRRNKRALALLLIVGVVLLSAWQIVPVTVAALVAAILAIVVGCIDAEEAYQAIDWPTLFLIAGSLALGTALEKTHTAEYIARVLMVHLAHLGPWPALTLIVLLASILTNFLSNSAVVALLVPLSIEVAGIVHGSPRAFLIAVTLGASACFATPIGYQTNTLVFTAGGYRFSDFVRVGLPLNLIYWIGASLLIPIFWPLT